MMSEMLEFARGGDRLEPTRGDVAAFLEGIEKSFRSSLREQGTSLEVQSGYGGEWTLDFGRTTRVVENLVRNAAGALQSGGTIRLSSSLEGGRLRIAVADDGPGIPEELRASLFEPFVTHGKVGGTGLGLATAKALTERQGGRIWLDASGSGTTFCLEFAPGLEPQEGAA